MVCCGAIWHRTDKSQNRCTTTIPHVHKSPKDVLENLLSVWLGVHKLVHSEPFLDYLYELWQLLSVLYNDIQKFFLYRCTSTFSALSYCGGIFFKPLSYLYTVVCTNFLSIFGLFTIFDCNFTKLVEPPSKKNTNYQVPLKGQSVLKKTM